MCFAKPLKFTLANTPAWLLATVAVLAAVPLDGLISVWSEDVGRSGVAWLVTVCGGILLGRLVGEQLPGSATSQRYALSLLLCGAVLRSTAPLPRCKACVDAGLMLDSYALAVLAGTRREQRPLPPGKLALAGALWLPTEVVLRGALNAVVQPLAAL